MVANYFLGAAILMLTSDISYSTGPCLCSGYLFRYSTDCCREPIWEVRTTQKPVWDMWSTRRPFWYARTTTQIPLWKRSTTRRSTTPNSYTEDFATIIGASVGGVTGLAFLCCFIAACVRVNRVPRRRFQGHQAQPQPQCHPRGRGILFIVIRRILVRRCQASADTENLISNPQVNSGSPQTTAYTYNRRPYTPVEPPPYSPASPSVPPPPYSEYI